MGWSSCEDSGLPETYAMRPLGAIAIPPVAPGIGIVWIGLPIRAARLRLQIAKRAPPRQFGPGSTRTIRVSFSPRPDEIAQRWRRRESGCRHPGGSRAT